MLSNYGRGNVYRIDHIPSAGMELRGSQTAVALRDQIASKKDKKTTYSMDKQESHRRIRRHGEWKKRSEATQTLRAGCSKAEPKMFAPPQTPFPGARTAKI